MSLFERHRRHGSILHKATGYKDDCTVTVFIEHVFRKESKTSEFLYDHIEIGKKVVFLRWLCRCCH
jgi:hypothetical protein